MTSWADESEDPVAPLEQAPSEYTGGGGVRPRLNLKPRSATAGQGASSAGGSSSKSNPFGAAKPREQVLAAKGIDASLVDKRVEKKASVARLTADQDKQVEELRTELTTIEEKLREANEMELPEEDHRVAAETKREELNELIAGFNEVNLKERNETDGGERGTGSGKERESGGGGHGAGSPQRKFERPSERRRRLEQERGDGGGGGGGHRGGRYQNNDDEGGEGEDPYSSFGSNRHRGGGGGGRGDHGHGGGGDGGGFGDRGGRGGRGGGGSYNDRGSRGRREGDGGYDGGGGHRGSKNNNYNDDKYAGDRYNY